MQTRTEQEAKEKIGEMIRDINIALLVTQDQSGNFHARPMGTQKPDKDKPFTGELWFMTDVNSPKVAEIKENPKVLLSYAEPKKQDYISVAGTASIVIDKAKVKEFWTEAFKTWFPDGPDDPDIALIRVDAEAAEYWDAPSKTIVYAYGYFKAKLTGEQPDIGENRKIAI